MKTVVEASRAVDARGWLSHPIVGRYVRVVVGVVVLGTCVALPPVVRNAEEREASEKRATRDHAMQQQSERRERAFVAATRDRLARSEDTKTYLRGDGSIDWSKDTVASFRARGGLTSNSSDAAIQAIIERNHKELFARDAIRSGMRHP